MSFVATKNYVEYMLEKYLGKKVKRKKVYSLLWTC